MADSFTANHVQGVFGDFSVVFDYATNDPTADNAQGVFGLFEAVFDEAGAAIVGISAAARARMEDLLAERRGRLGRYGI